MMFVDFGKAGITSLCLSMVLLAVPAVLGDEAVSRDSGDRWGTPANGPRVVVGLSASKCSNCHGKTPSAADDELPRDVRGRGNDGWIRGDELLTWVRDDYHYQAYTVLLNERSHQIAKRLGIVAHQDRRCLACHSSMPVNQMPVNGDCVLEDTQQDPRYTIGVSCEACHGPAGTGSDGTKGWEEVHVVNPLWRTMNSKSKFEEFGYWDVHSTRTQTRICLSCHLGNIDQRKIITHEMYAAGHPPLPSFELSQFVHQLPRHWRRLDEKPKQVREEFLECIRREGEESGVVFNPEELAVSKTTMIAAFVTLEESMQLTADLIGNPSVSAQWPELANYACFACHHELLRGGWRNTPRLTATPGRPTLHEWPFVLSRVVAAALDDDGADFQFEAEIHSLAAALNSRPYGDFVELKNAATVLAKGMEMRSRKINSISINRDRAKSLLKSIADFAAAEFVDYDSARQLVWAYERTNSELELMNPLDKHQPSASAEVPQTWIGGNPSLNEFECSLELSLRGNRLDKTTVELKSGKDSFTHAQRAVNISSALEKIAKYDPRSIKAGFKKLKNIQTKNVDAQK